jgi:hypothetical protein
MNITHDHDLVYMFEFKFSLLCMPRSLHYFLSADRSIKTVRVETDDKRRQDVQK